ncbi:MAG: aminoglycoside phosphotransferase family protein [Defluviitaleaceae bacterium]|nr:aminoglycoside phosphotransferase family protein [Defluviitaleaceae bacterium]
MHAVTLSRKEKEFLITIAGNFDIDGTPLDVMPLGNGNINKTYRVRTTTGDYSLQRININTFKPYDILHRNIKIAMHFLKKEVAKEGRNPDLEILSLVDTLDGKLYYFSDEKTDIFMDSKTGENDIIGCFRLTNIIPDAYSIQKAEHPGQLGEMAAYLSDWSRKLTKCFNENPNLRLGDTLPDYHDTPKHFEKLIEAARKDPLGRYRNPAAKELMKFYEKHADKYGIIMDGIKNNTIAQGVVHRDPKINNFMYNTYWNHIQALIDLDTIYYHPFAIDISDATRAIATEPETETDLTKVKANIKYLKPLLDNYLKNIGPLLTETDWKNMKDYLSIIGLELGMRFFADHLAGDKYFSIISYPDQNLDKGRNQAAVSQSLFEQSDEVEKIIEGCHIYKAVNK